MTVAGTLARLPAWRNLRTAAVRCIGLESVRHADARDVHIAHHPLVVAEALVSAAMLTVHGYRPPARATRNRPPGLQNGTAR